MPRTTRLAAPTRRQPTARPPATRRDGVARGVTLVEMLVVVALLVLMMTILVQIFASATGAISVSRRYSELDSGLRLLDGTLRRDLSGVTAKMTPPNDPKDGRGYFEYGENGWADPQGEDTDDFIAFTAKAPDGQPFTGRAWVEYSTPPIYDYTDPKNPFIVTNSNVAGNYSVQPVIVSSQYAEIIYFLRNGNLYRRVLLIAPERQASVVKYGGISGTTYNPVSFGFPTLTFPCGVVGWLGVNDISARPALVSTNPSPPPALNNLGDLTNRENRFARPRFMNYYLNQYNTNTNPNQALLANDGNQDGVNDYYPTLFPNLFLVGTNGPYLSTEDPNNAGTGNYLAGAGRQLRNIGGHLNYDNFPFPFIYPYAYSLGDPTMVATPHGVRANYTLGSIHGAQYPIAGTNASLSAINHNPVSLGENVELYYHQNYGATGAGTPLAQSFFGFPTWRETVSVNWKDPALASPNVVGGGNFFQAPGLRPFNPATGAVPAQYQSGLPLPLDPSNANSATYGTAAQLAMISSTAPYATDHAGSVSFAVPYVVAGNNGVANFPGVSFGFPANPLSPNMVFEDDLVLSGVRSFDIKAFDPFDNAYRDLGSPYRDDGIATTIYASIFGNGAPPLTDNGNQGYPEGVIGGLPNSVNTLTNGTLNYPPQGLVNALLSTFAHEGRIPPLYRDYRMDAQFPTIYPGGNLAFREGGAQGKLDNTDTIRLRRTFDTWSTDYTTAPAADVNLNGNTSLTPLNFPLYPSYPPPYPSALRGIKIQVRLVDPGNERIKSLTIVQDFTDRLE